ncbi:hypothetical protein SDC9_151863 [bioreactor metagenome]|uniref:4Fe-4S ferredoxin-type domain-containing protein n=1 Tax=bioreactor metagenome TaxID=1076179 RepID=A0A645ETU7_9ZZZZ
MVCEDTSHQAIFYTKGEQGERRFEINEAECVGCNLCVSICPVPDTISMRTLAVGEVDARTGIKVTGEYGNWTTHPNNPQCLTTAEA